MTRPMVGRPGRLINNNHPVKRVPGKNPQKPDQSPKPENENLSAAKPDESDVADVEVAQHCDVASVEVAQHCDVVENKQQHTTTIPSYFSVRSFFFLYFNYRWDLNN